MSIHVPVLSDKTIEIVCGKDGELTAYPGSCIAYNSYKDQVNIGVMMYPPNKSGLYPIWGGAVLHWVEPDKILHILLD